MLRNFPGSWGFAPDPQTLTVVFINMYFSLSHMHVCTAGYCDCKECKECLIWNYLEYRSSPSDSFNLMWLLRNRACEACRVHADDNWLNGISDLDCYWVNWVTNIFSLRQFQDRMYFRSICFPILPGYTYILHVLQFHGYAELASDGIWK